MTKSISSYVHNYLIPRLIPFRLPSNYSKLLEGLIKTKINPQIKAEIITHQKTFEVIDPFPKNHYFKVETESGLSSPKSQFIFKKQMHLTPEKPSIFERISVSEDHSGGISLELHYKGCETEKLKEIFENNGHNNFAHNEKTHHLYVWVNRSETDKLKKHLGSLINNNYFSKEGQIALKGILNQIQNQKNNNMPSHLP